jgi:hypothetical protein
MNHHHLCPRKKVLFKKCQCGLIDKVILENNDLIRLLQSTDHREKNKNWYYSGRQDAAEDIENLMHHDTCNCTNCAVLILAYKTVLGIKFKECFKDSP